MLMQSIFIQRTMDTGLFANSILEILEDEVDADHVEKMVRFLQNDPRTKYRRKTIQDIGTNFLKLFDTMSKRGDIKVDKVEYSLLLDLLDKVKLSDAANELNTKIDEYKAEQSASRQNMFNQETSRPESLSVKPVPVSGDRKRSADSSMLSPSDYVGLEQKRNAFSSAHDRNVQSDDGGPRLKYFKSGKGSFYTLNPDRKGLVVIINNFTGKNAVHPSLVRNGTIEDEEKIIGLFRSKGFSDIYTVDDVHRDVDYEEFENILDQLVERLTEDCERFDSFLLFILSHGDENGVKTFYADPKNPPSPIAMPVDNIMSKFKDCLPDRPKVFVIQACQGIYDNKSERRPQLVHADSDPGPCPQPNDLEGENSEEVESDEISIDMGGPPEAADMLTAFATVKGYRSYRSQKRTATDSPGAWFIQKLIKLIKDAHSPQYYSTDLAELLSLVQQEVAVKTGSASTTPDGESGCKKVTVKQMPCFQSSLRRKFYLLPPKLCQHHPDLL